MAEQRGKTMTRRCKCCGDPFTARVADVKRGWGKFCSKSCKAIKQEQRTGQYASFLERRDAADLDEHPFSSEALGQS